jgi:hypothetical protein
MTPARQYRQSVARLTRISAITSVEVNIDDPVVESSALIAFDVVWYLSIEVDTEKRVPPGIMAKKNSTLNAETRIGLLRGEVNDMPPIRPDPP